MVLEPLLRRPGKRGPAFGADLQTVVGAMLYVSHTGCQWRSLPAEFGRWARVWPRVHTVSAAQAAQLTARPGAGPGTARGLPWWRCWTRWPDRRRVGPR